MMYTNKRNGNVVEVIEINEKFKTVTIEENGKTKTVSTSTLKRWYTPIEVETIDVDVPDDVDVVETKTETIDYTDNELAVIKTIGSYLNYELLEENLDDNATYLDVTESAKLSGLSVKTVKGIVGSLVKKELIVTDILNGDEKILYVTNFGLREYFRLFVDNKTEIKTEKKSKTTKKSDKKSVEKKEVKTKEKKSRRIYDVIDIDTLTEEGVPTEITDILIENDVDVINTKGMLTLRDIDGKNIARVRVNAKKNSFRLQLKPNNITPDKQINHSFSYVYEGELSDVELFKNLIEQSMI